MSNIQVLEKIAEFSIPVVETHQPVQDPVSFLNYVKDLKNFEGFVIAWDSGYRVKVKAADYLRKHKTKDAISFEKNIISLLVNEQMDDVKAFMLNDDREQVEQFEKKFWDGIAGSVAVYNTLFNVELAGIDRKQFALELMPKWQEKDAYVGAIMFGLYNGRDTFKMLTDIIAKNCNTQTRIDSVRYLWGNHKWNNDNNGNQ